MPVVQISCSGHNPQKALVSIERYPTLSAFLQTLPARFNVKPQPKATLTYVENGQPYDITDDEGWMIALGEMEAQPKPTLVWTIPISAKRERDRDVSEADREGMDVFSQLLGGQGAVPPQGSEAVNSVQPKRRRRSSKNPTVDASSVAPSPIKRQQQQTELYRRISKEQGHAAAFQALDRSWQERYYALAEIVQDIFGSRHYLLNPLEVACPLCLASIKLSQICERRMGNLMHAQHHLRKVHYDSPIELVRETARTLVQRWEERFSHAKTCITPLTDDMKRCLRDITGGRDIPPHPQLQLDPLPQSQSQVGTTEKGHHPLTLVHPHHPQAIAVHQQEQIPAVTLSHQTAPTQMLGLPAQSMSHVIVQNQ